MPETPKHPDESSRLRWLVPLAVLAMAWLALFPITSVDAYYHLATGQRILEQQSIPQRGVGSATFGREAWHDNEWGFQVVTALLGRSTIDATGLQRLTGVGAAALIALRALCLALTLTLLASLMSRRGVDRVTRALGVVLVAFLTFGNLWWTVRPQIFSYLGLALLAYLLERDREGAWRLSVSAIPVVIAVWANIHGAFVIGVALVGIEALGQWLDARREGAGGRRRAVRLGLLTLVLPLAAMVNPHGYRQLLHPFLYLLAPEIHAGNAEWTRPDFLHLPLLVCTVGLWAVALAVARPFRWTDALRGLTFLALLTTAIRHLPLASIVIVPSAMAGLSQAARQRGRLRHLLPTAPQWGGLGARLAAAALLTAAIVGLSGARFITPWPRLGERPARPMPERALRVLSSSGLTGPGFNAYRFGGFLMYRLYPREVVFMDGRNDLYRGFRHRVYNRILNTEHGWRSLWEQSVRNYGIEWVLIDEDEPLATELLRDPRWLGAPSGGPWILDGRAGVDGVALFVRDTTDNRRRLADAAAVTARNRHDDPAPS